MFYLRDMYCSLMFNFKIGTIKPMINLLPCTTSGFYSLTIEKWLEILHQSRETAIRRNRHLPDMSSTFTFVASGKFFSITSYMCFS